MKRMISLILAVLFCCTLLLGCAKKEEMRTVETVETADASEAKETAVPVEPESSNDAAGVELVGMPNPMAEMDSVEAVNREVGCYIRTMKDMNEKVTDESFTVIRGEPKIGQYSLLIGGIPITVRAGITEGDISGIYMSDGTMPGDHLTEQDPYAIVDTGYGVWTRWFVGGMQYCILAGDGKDYSMKLNELGYGTLLDLINLLRDFEALVFPWYDFGEEGMNTGEEGEDLDEEGNYAMSLRAELASWNATNATSFGTGTIRPFDSAAQHPNGEYANSVQVSSIDEFLAALAPDTEITFAPGTYSLSSASDYGTGSSKYYQWVDVGDGYELAISCADRLSIRGSLTDDGNTVTLESALRADPRYAEVIRFTNCRDICVSGLVLGHTLGGACVGGVISFDSCAGAYVSGCRLYGCGTYGVEGNDSKNLKVMDSIVHNCTYGHVDMYNCENVSFERCSFLATSGYTGNSFYSCRSVSYKNCDFGYNNLDSLFNIDGTDALTLDNCLVAYNFFNSETGMLSGNAQKYNITGGACVDYGMDEGTYGEIAFG